MAQARTINFVVEQEKLRGLPSVHEALALLDAELGRYPRALVLEETRRALDAMRAEIRAGRPSGLSVYARVRDALAAWEQPSLRRVINAAGVVLHTNLGRAPLGAFTAKGGYSNLEYDLASGRRGKRDSHLSVLLERLLGAPAIVVNNNAAAVFLILNEMAAGGEALISRGELVEIGDGFRIPEIMARSGAAIREVGTTNRTFIADYREALNERTRLLVRVHPSNFRMQGFTARPELRELCALGRECGTPVYEDLGSGCLTDLRTFGVDEPLVTESLAAGAALVSFSGDKLLGGPQAGIITGAPELIARLRRNPLFRALRLDKMATQVLERTLRATLLERWEELPAIAMIRQSAERIKQRAETMVASVGGRFRVEAGESLTGGGSTPEQPLPTWLITLEHEDAGGLERALRNCATPVIARIQDGKLSFDLRTVGADEEEELAAALRSLPQ